MTPREELERVLDPEHSQAVIDHRKAKRAPLTAYAAKLLARKFEKAPDPNAAADAMIVNGWQGFEVEWLERQTTRSNGHAPKGADYFDIAAEFIEHETNGSGSGFTSDRSHAQGMARHSIEDQRGNGGSFPRRH